METKNDSLEALYARLDDLYARAERGELGISAFLSPRELHYAAAYLERVGRRFITFGGYSDAERRRVYILPDYLEGVEDAWALSDFGLDSEIRMLSVKGSGFVGLNHRDFMGSLLGLGLKRDVIGDIVIVGESEAAVLCDGNIVEFLLSHWEKAGRDKIKVTETDRGSDFAPERRMASVTDTVASPRLDCVVAALCSLSREKAREAVVSALVELDYECEERPDREVRPPCVLSVRGYGRFAVDSLADKTKKGRYRLIGRKYL